MVLIESFLVVGLSENECDYFGMSYNCRRSPTRVELINYSRMANDCISAKSGHTLIAQQRGYFLRLLTIRHFLAHLRLCILTTENVDAAFTTVNDIHAIADGSLIHQ